MKLLQLGKCHQRNSKRGGMLVIVLMIFAVSLILISSAMTITLSSRSRYYVDTERSQERLTLTCAAEAVVDAIEAQEITDEQLVAMSSTPTKPFEITGSTQTSKKAGAVADDGKKIAPGLSTKDGNRTYMYVKPVSGSKDIDLEFSTVIDVTGEDKKAECLHVHLKYYPPTEPKKICQNMVTCGEEGSYNDLPKLEVNATESFTVFHGDVYLSSGSGSYIHNPTVITGVVKGGSGTKYHNDIIFYGPDAGILIPGDGNGVWIEYGEGDFYFLGVDPDNTNAKQKAFVNSAGGLATGHGLNVRASAAYFYNSEMQVDDYTMAGSPGVGTKYWIVGQQASVKRTNPNDGANNVVVKAGGSASIASLSTTVYDSYDAADNDAKAAYTRVTTKAAKYISEGKLKAAAEATVPTCAEALADYGGFTSGEMITQHQGDINLDGGKAYQMAGDYKNGVCKIDLSKGSASIYISDDVMFSIYRIEVSNATKNKLTIVIAKGKSFTMKDNYASDWPAQGAAGIVSCDTRKSCTFADFTNNAYGDLHAKSGEEPACIIVGLGKNVFSAGRANVVDAYISLAGTGTDASTVTLKDKVNFYGRFEAVNVDTGNSDNLTMDYCPGVGEGSNKPTPLVTCYKAETYEYHY